MITSRHPDPQELDKKARFYNLVAKLKNKHKTDYQLRQGGIRYYDYAIKKINEEHKKGEGNREMSDLIEIYHSLINAEICLRSVECGNGRDKDKIEDIDNKLNTIEDIIFSNT